MFKKRARGILFTYKFTLCKEGLTRLVSSCVNRALHRVEQVFWLIVILGCIAATGWQLFGVFGKFFAYQPSSQISIAFKSPVEFPSVTVCNLNPIRKSLLGLDKNMKRFFDQQANIDNFIDQCQLDSIWAQKVTKELY